MPEPERGPHLRDRSTRRPFRPLIAQRTELLVGFIGADLAMRGDDPLLDLVHERVRDPPPIRRFGDRLTRVTGGDMPGNRVMGTARQLGCSAQPPGQVVGSKYFHDFSVKLHSGLFLGDFGAF
ncbi:hypothetical protein HNR05_001069 [Leifsonia psychrotolerans]|uniref:Uncharacterized protein n=1 Tax=Glaciibacter psychrotolerans TaxID=670054 RepID=A0A7Z0ECS4_9MICO|nr:hypothetical protein [Leifsonia psychrotolerans]NYJ19278.1 hypothetical protein [Leifsonia psychrotolerans]